MLWLSGALTGLRIRSLGEEPSSKSFHGTASGCRSDLSVLDMDGRDSLDAGATIWIGKDGFSGC